MTSPIFKTNKIKTADSQSVLVTKKKNIVNHYSPISKGYVSVTVHRKNGDTEIIQKNEPNLLTNAGRDYLIAQSYTNTRNGGRGAGFIGLSSDAVAPNVQNTGLGGEITSGGLRRVDATTKTHAVGTNSITISHVFNATVTNSNVHKAALFTALANGTVVNVDAFTNDFSLQNGDSVTIIWNIAFG